MVEEGGEGGRGGGHSLRLSEGGMLDLKFSFPSRMCFLESPSRPLDVGGTCVAGVHSSSVSSVFVHTSDVVAKAERRLSNSKSYSKSVGGASISA